MLSHWAVDACAASSWKRATLHTQNASHSPVDKSGSAQKANILEGLVDQGGYNGQKVASG